MANGLSKEQMIEVKENLIALYDIIVLEPRHDIAHAVRMIPDMVDFINSNLETETIDNEGKKWLYDGFKSMFCGKAGLSEFYVWDYPIEVRRRINDNFDKVKRRLRMLLEEEGTQIL